MFQVEEIEYGKYPMSHSKMESLRVLAVILSGTAVTCEGSVVLTQTHPAAPYVCRTGNITLRCQYESVENVVGVVWAIGSQITSNASTIPGHTALPSTTTYQEVVVDSYASMAVGYRCEPTLSNGSQLLSNQYNPQYESAEVTLSSLTLASRTATTLSVTWSAGYPKCYSFTVSHSTQDGSINVTQPADSDTSHTLTSLQPGTTYKFEVEAVRKGDGADGQRAKFLAIYTTDGPDYTECTFRFCKRRRNALCTKPDAAGDCTNKVTSCKAAYYSVNERPPPPKCSRKNRCAGLIGERFEGCLIKWANCVKKAFRSQHGRTPSNLRKKGFFKTLEYPCSG